MQGSHQAPYAKMPHIGGRYGVSFIEKGGKYGTLEGKGTASVKKKGRYCINMEFKKTKIPGQQK